MAILATAGALLGSTGVTSWLGDSVGGLFGSEDYSGQRPPIPAVLYAVQQATAAERQWLAEALGSEWRSRYDINNLSDTGAEQISLLFGGGLNERYNSDERRIRERTLTLLSRYPLGGSSGGLQPTAPAPTQSGTGGNWWEAVSGGVSWNEEDGLQVGARIDNKAQQMTTFLYAAGAVVVVLLLVVMLGRK